MYLYAFAVCHNVTLQYFSQIVPETCETVSIPKGLYSVSPTYIL